MATKDTAAAVNFQPAVTKRASEIIFDQVKEMIVNGELKPGDRLPSERNMMDMFQRSRPTIREALRMLERGGYIRTIAGSNGAMVLEPDNRNIQQTMEDALKVGHVSLTEMSEFRAVSEVATVVWACERRTEEDLEKLHAHLEKMDVVIEDPVAYIAMDPVFHGLLANAGKNEICAAVNETISNINQQFMGNKLNTMKPTAQKKMLQKVQGVHWEIYEAIKDRDAERARKVMIEHLNAFGSDLR